MADFVHLHNHSEFSLLDGLSKIKNLVSYAKDLGMHSLAITDHGVMYGAVRFYSECKKQGIKPIIGCEIYITKGSRFSRESSERDYNHLILLAENFTGYQNLMRIVSKAWLEGYYYKPRTDLDLLREHSEGLICLSACVNGFVSDPLLAGQEKEAESRAKALSEIFGPDHFYLELQKHLHVGPQDRCNELLVGLSRKLGLPLVATNDNHYTKPTDAKAQEILLCIQTQTTVDTPNRKLSMIDSPDFYLKTAEEMEKLFAEYPEAVENTVKIAERCNVEIELGKWHMPDFPIPDGLTPDTYLRKMVYEGLANRYDQIKGYDFSKEPQGDDYQNGADDPQSIDVPTVEQIMRRVNYEMHVIETKGYATYFLIVADFVNWAKDHGISVGPGRGSGAGSVVAYTIRITDIDPFFFHIPFERFLNPLRPSAPDIDLDFADVRREEVVAYVTEKYGKDRVAQIITFGKMEAKGVIRDVGRAIGMSFAQTDRIAKLIPPGWQGHSISLENAIKESPDLKRLYDEEEETRNLITLAQGLESVSRHASVHAAGVVIAPAPLTDFTPIQREPNGGEKVVTQYDMRDVGEDGVGLLKMDFLGLRNLTIIEEAIKFIKANQGIEIDSSKIPFDNKKAYELLSSAETTGIFQFESAGMRRYIKELKPTTIFDLAAMVALYRPGPIASIPEYISRKNNPALIRYPDPRLTDLLKPSLGMLVYQDDVMLTAITIAGYTWLDADKFRKAMGKKIPEEMKKQEEHFMEGAQEYGKLSEKEARALYDLIAPFAGYGFNKAHSACYATIAYRTAFLKANYPVEFMTALLTAESRGVTGPARDEKIAQAVAECKRLSLTLLIPDINKSVAEFSIEDNTKIRFGLSAIKNVGAAAISMIIEEREKGPYRSLEDFINRLSGAAINKKTLESLIKAGAMDAFGKRSVMLAVYPEIVEAVTKSKKRKADGQVSLFGDDSEEEVTAKNFQSTFGEVDDFSHEEKLGFEKELLGVYLQSHPQEKKLKIAQSEKTHELSEIEELPNGTDVTLVGYITQVKRLFTKKTNAEMAFMVLSAIDGSNIECIVFPKVFEIHKNDLVKDNVLIVSGKVDTKDRPVILVNAIRVPQAN